MGTVSAKKINDALAKARNVGITEEKFSIGDCELVLRNLRPAEYTAAQTETSDLLEASGQQYLEAFQKAHVCRSIVQLNGYSFRDIDYVEVEEEEKDPKTGEPKIDPATNQPKVKKFTVERYVYFRDYVLNTWGREAVFVAFRKFTDVQALAEQRAKDGITFIRPAETPEDMFRRLVDELKEVEDQVPEPMLDAILAENGYMRKSTADEIKAAMAKTDQLAREQAAAESANRPPSDDEPPAEAAEAPVAPPPPPPAPLPTGVRRVSAEEIMRSRQPMNQAPAPVPPVQAQGPNAGPTQAATQIPQGPVHIDPTVLKRAGKVANIEMSGLDVEGGPTLPQLPTEAAVLAHKGAEKVDINAFRANVEQPPRAGINPKFKPRMPGT